MQYTNYKVELLQYDVKKRGSRVEVLELMELSPHYLNAASPIYKQITQNLQNKSSRLWKWAGNFFFVASANIKMEKKVRPQLEENTHKSVKEYKQL